MPREAYRDRRRYEDEERDYYRKKERYTEERGTGSSRDHDKRRSEEDKGRNEKRRPIDGPNPSSSSSRITRRSRSRSPDFERDRARERQSYDRRRLEDSTRSTGEANEQPERSTEPNFESSGLLAKESNSKNGVALKYAEPAEARKPKKKWRLYVFKDGKEVDVLHISRQSCYLMGRDRAVADIPIDHPSISKQHAVIQFRNIRECNEYGDEKQSTKPFLIDLDSANGSLINDAEVPASRYYEMRNGDSLKLGGSQREYVLLAEE